MSWKGLINKLSVLFEICESWVLEFLYALPSKMMLQVFAFIGEILYHTLPNFLFN